MVLTVIVVVPLPVTEAGLKLHDASAGNPAHEAGVKLIVPVYPGCPVIARVVVPLCPGELIVTALRLVGT
jgi:hypothetical protein